MNNLTAPKFRRLPKVHKVETPIRPLVNFTIAPTYKILKFLDRIINKEIYFNNNHGVKNSYEL